MGMARVKAKGWPFFLKGGAEGEDEGKGVYLGIVSKSRAEGERTLICFIVGLTRALTPNSKLKTCARRL